MLLYMALAPEQKLTYKEGGPAAEARFEAGLAGFEARSFRGCGVMTSEPFEVSDDNESLQMLTRNSQIGEFYVMAPPQVEPKDSPLHTCDIMIFGTSPTRSNRTHAWHAPSLDRPLPPATQTRSATPTCASRGRTP